MNTQEQVEDPDERTTSGTPSTTSLMQGRALNHSFMSDVSWHEEMSTVDLAVCVGSPAQRAAPPSSKQTSTTIISYQQALITH